MPQNWKQWLYSAVCAGLLVVLGWANATGYVLFGEASKNAASHATSTYHK